MKKLSFILCACILAATLFSCSHNYEMEDYAPEYSGKVLVMLNLDSTYYARVGYEDHLKASIRSNGANPEIRFVYQCGIQPVIYQECHKRLDELAAQGWKPDLVCVSEDRLLDNILSGRFDPWLDFSGAKYPIIAAGLHCPNWALINEYGNIAVCTDLIDFESNLLLAKSISGSSVVTIELDYTAYDLRLRERLNQATNRPPFVNNSDFHVRSMKISEMEKLFHDSILINVFSNANPEKNNFHDDPKLFRKRVLQTVGSATYLSAKKDLDSDNVLNHSAKPQFTAVREGFHDGTGHLLCGYFASYETVANDQGAYVAKVLDGTNTGELPILAHKRDYYADWESMILAGYKLKTFKNPEENGANIGFRVVGVPFTVEYHLMIRTMQLLAALIILLFCIRISRYAYQRPFKKMDAELEKLNQDFMLFSSAVQNSDCIFTSKKEDVVALRDRMHPDETVVLNNILYGSSGGKDTESPVIRLTDDDGKTWRRWQFRRGTIVGGSREDLPGVFIDVEETYKYKEQMARNAEIAEQIRLKENFVKNITHEIRTPLNAIVGFSQILGMDDGSMTDSEREEIAKYVHESNTDLCRIIDVILKFSRLESGRIDFDPEDTNIADMMTSIYENWKGEAPPSIDFILHRGRQNVFAMIDRRSLRDIMGQYLSNALKFTTSGYVKLGWDFNLDDDTVLLYVEDTGKGISQEKRKFIYNMFWKDDMFVTGVGLGLALAKTYTKKMNGEIVLQTKEGIGSLFGSRFKARIGNL